MDEEPVLHQPGQGIFEEYSLPIPTQAALGQLVFACVHSARVRELGRTPVQ